LSHSSKRNFCSNRMLANLIDGKSIAADIRTEIKDKVAAIASNGGTVPGLAVILVGARRDSQTYVNMKKKACAAAGIVSIGYDFEDNVTEKELLATIQRLNVDSAIHGILVQLPLPAHLDQDKILQAVDPAKDVDGLHPMNVAALQLYSGNALEAPFSIACTPLGCLVLLEKSGIDLKGKHCVVVGRSQLVGLPMARLLLGRDATVTIAHSKTEDIQSLTRTADVVVAAAGRAHLVEGNWIKPGAVVIDVGINSVDIVPEKEGGKTYKLVGDVDFDAAVEVCSQITPVPGGVGPMTIAMLLRNTLRSCERLNLS
jgi:5,10-methylene-tetrahydrofolate dehydrogenase/methenyl tetrahydrofolate cyclohydrolase